jgi:hypothetical protein
VSDRRSHRRHIEDIAQLHSAAPDVALAATLATVGVVRRNADQGSNLAAVEPAQFGQPGGDRSDRHRTDAGHRVKPLGQGGDQRAPGRAYATATFIGSLRVAAAGRAICVAEGATTRPSIASLALAITSAAGCIIASAHMRGCRPRSRTYSMNTHLVRDDLDVDVLVVGAGPAGVALALRLRRLVARFIQIEGYRCLSLMRASGVVNCQFALA